MICFLSSVALFCIDRINGLPTSVLIIAVVLGAVGAIRTLYKIMGDFKK